MLTAHLPSGYVLARSLPPHVPYLLPAALLGAVLPDFDMIWFHLVDNRAIHHRYWVHIPAFWLAVALPTLLILRRGKWFATALVFFGAIFMHLILDSLSGGILWGAPFSDRLMSLTTVPATRSHWVWSFVFHWSFAAELLIWAAAINLWFRRGKQ
jgi:hypothetical protein